MSGKCCGSGWLSGLGSFMTGIAACSAVYFSKEPISNYFNNVSQSQVVVVNICEAKKQVDELIKKSNNPTSFEEYFRSIPSEVSKGSAKPMGLVIAPEYRDMARGEIEKADSPMLKREILKNYWEKSLSKETKSTVDLQLNGGK